jgi:hypothetical protein
MRKKGAINLSINMIIVLIIAIIILGFALGFIQSMFGNLEQQLTGQLPELDIPVDADNPVGIPSNFRIDPGSERSFRVNVLNTGSSIIRTNSSTGNSDRPSSPYITCQKSSDTSLTVSNVQDGIEIPAGETGTVPMFVRAETGLQNNDICVIHFLNTSQGEVVTNDFFTVTE